MALIMSGTVKNKHESGPVTPSKPCCADMLVICEQGGPAETITAVLVGSVVSMPCSSAQPSRRKSHTSGAMSDTRTPILTASLKGPIGASPI